MTKKSKKPEVVGEAENVEVSSQPESLGAGVSRDEEKQNPVDLMVDKPRVEGNWIDVTDKELAELEASGKLIGYDRVKGQALVKEE